MSLLRALLLDLNNVGENYDSYRANFGPVHRSVIARACTTLGVAVTSDTFEPLIREYLSFCGDIPFQHHPSFWQHVFERVLHRGLTLDEIQRLYRVYLDAYEQWIECYPDFGPAVTRARELGLKVGLVANGNTARIYRFLEKFGLREQMDTIVASSGTPFCKPGFEIFELARRNLCAPPPIATAFVGDRLENDVSGANRVGMWSIHLVRSAVTPSAPQTPIETPDYTIANLDDLFFLPLFALRNPVTAAVIPCGGRGKRMGRVTDATQKCMLVVNGGPLLAQVVAGLAAAGIHEVHFLLGYRGDDVREYFQSSQNGCHYHFHDVNEASTGRALVASLEDLPDTFIYCHGNITAPPFLLATVLKAYHKAHDSSVFVITKQPVARTHPGFLVGDARPQAVLRHVPLDDPNAFYSLGLGVLAKRDVTPTRGLVTTEELFASSLDHVRTVRYEGDWAHFEKAEDLDMHMSRAAG